MRGCAGNYEQIKVQIWYWYVDKKVDNSVWVVSWFL